jgi:hypothetical protein
VRLNVISKLDQVRHYCCSSSGSSSMLVHALNHQQHLFGRDDIVKAAPLGRVMCSACCSSWGCVSCTTPCVIRDCRAEYLHC